MTSNDVKKHAAEEAGMEYGQKSLYEIFGSYNAKQEGDVKKKGNYDYLPWATAWEEVLKIDPSATYDVERDPVTNKLYSEVGNSAVVCVKVRIYDVNDEIIERKEYYPVEGTPMHAIPLEKLDASAWNRAVKRGLVKCLSQFGLGLQLYRGEDLTEVEKDEIAEDIVSLIGNAASEEELLDIYNMHASVVSKTPKLLKMFTARKEELKG